MKDRYVVVILPGWGGSHETWQSFVELASKTMDVKVIDLPCFGSEPCPDTVWGIEEYSDFVKRQIVKLSNCQIVLFGHSFGGQVAVYLVANNPDICSKLILSGAAVFRKKASLKRVIFLPIAKLGKLIFKLPVLKRFDKLAKKVLYKVIDSPDYDKTSGMKRNIYKKVVRQDVSADLQLINKETLVVWGSKDRHTPLKFGKKIVQMIPKAKLEIFEGGKHGLHLHQTNKLFEVVDHFITS